MKKYKRKKKKQFFNCESCGRTINEATFINNYGLCYICSERNNKKGGQYAE